MAKKAQITKIDTKEINRLVTKNNITETHAYCYMCNFEDNYICHKAYGGCELLNKCKQIV